MSGKDTKLTDNGSYSGKQTRTEEVQIEVLMLYLPFKTTEKMSNIFLI